MSEVQQLADPAGALVRQRFFKTGPGEYGEGDLFFGLTVPAQRRIAKRFRDLPHDDVEQLLASAYHECRFIALAILVLQYQRGSHDVKAEIVAFYLERLEHVNDWDLVDTQRRTFLGSISRRQGMNYLTSSLGHPTWTRRVTVVSTLAMIRAWNTAPALRISAILLADRHDLIHKAVGWMLREVGIVDRPALLRFLQLHYGELSRTSLRYAIEHFTPKERKAALSGQFPTH